MYQGKTFFRGIRTSGNGELQQALVKGYSQMTKECNGMTGN